MRKTMLFASTSKYIHRATNHNGACKDSDSKSSSHASDVLFFSFNESLSTFLPFGSFRGRRIVIEQRRWVCPILVRRRGARWNVILTIVNFRIKVRIHVHINHTVVWFRYGGNENMCGFLALKVSTLPTLNMTIVKADGQFLIEIARFI